MSADPFQRLANVTSSVLLPVPNDSSTSNRPRNRRAGSSAPSGGAASSSTSHTPATSRRASPSRAGIRDGTPGVGVGGKGGGGGGGGGSLTPGSSIRKGLWDSSSWTPNWTSVTEFASSLISGEGSVYGSDGGSRGASRNSSRNRKPPRSQPGNWGPEPLPRIEDVAAGSLAERDAALRAMRTASVLESHDGVNGGLDVAGRFKRRSSDEDLRGTASTSAPGSSALGGSQQQSQDQPEEQQLVYIHHVKPSDTYAGIVLRYRCREDVFRKANGLWSRDNIQTRKVLTIPVDACEIKGRPCDPPSDFAPKVDLLAPTPEADNAWGSSTSASNVYGYGVMGRDDFFSVRPPNGNSSETRQQQPSASWDDKEFTHVRWVAIESLQEPVEIARVSRKNMGYFPPRRRKSLHTVSTLSTPRASLDVPSSVALSSAEAVESPGSVSSRGRRHSLLSTASRPHITSASNGVRGGSPLGSRNRVGSLGASSVPDELAARPAWMRRPGGVGSMGRHVRAPGPERDYFNSFARKHLPSFNLDSLPSMSVMGSETARFGFGGSAVDQGSSGGPAGIVESPFEDGRDESSARLAAASRQGTGLDKAAAAVETWLRGAFAKQPPGAKARGSSSLGGGSGTHGHSHSHGQDDLLGLGDLIELEDTNSEDGRGFGGGETSDPTRPSASLLGGGGSTGRSDAGPYSALRGRNATGTGRGRSSSKGGKTD